MVNSFQQSRIATVNHYTIAYYECRTKHEKKKGMLFATDEGLIFDPDEHDPAIIKYNEIINVQKIERGDQIFHKMIFHLYPILLVIAFILWIDDINNVWTNLLLFSFFPMYLSGRYLCHYWNYLQFDIIVDRYQLVEVKFKFRFVDMAYMHGVLRNHRARTRCDQYEPFDTSYLN